MRLAEEGLSSGLDEEQIPTRQSQFGERARFSAVDHGLRRLGLDPADVVDVDELASQLDVEIALAESRDRDAAAIHRLDPVREEAHFDGILKDRDVILAARAALHRLAQVEPDPRFDIKCRLVFLGQHWHGEAAAGQANCDQGDEGDPEQKSAATHEEIL